MTKPPRRLMSVPVQINQYVRGKPSNRERKPFFFMIDFLWRFQKYNRCSKIKESRLGTLLTTHEPVGLSANGHGTSLNTMLCVESPFPAAHDGLACPVFLDPIDIHLWRADHEVNVGNARVATGFVEFLVR